VGHHGREGHNAGLSAQEAPYSICPGILLVVLVLVVIVDVGVAAQLLHTPMFAVSAQMDKGVRVHACACVRAPLPSGRGVGKGGVEVDQALAFVGGGLEEPHVEEPHPALPW
jgi:hypothetical protein